MKDTEIKVNNKTVGEYDMIPDDNRPDWEQDDNESPNFVKNRPMYKTMNQSVSSKTPVDVISAKTGDIFRMDEDVNQYGGNYISIAVIISGLTKRAPTTASRIKQVFYDPRVKGERIIYWNLNYPSTVEDIGNGTSDIVTTQNRVCIIKDDDMIYFRVYLISDVKYLQDQYKSKFAKNGIYLEFVEMPNHVAKYCKLSFEAWYYHRLDANYLPLSSPVFMIPEAPSTDKNYVLTIDPVGRPFWEFAPPFACDLGYIHQDNTNDLNSVISHVKNQTTVVYTQADTNKQVMLLPYNDHINGSGYNTYNGIAILSKRNGLTGSISFSLYSITNGIDPTSMTFIPIDFVPAATSADAGKVLMIGSDGKPAWTTLPTSTGGNT